MIDLFQLEPFSISVRAPFILMRTLSKLTINTVGTKQRTCLDRQEIRSELTDTVPSVSFAMRSLCTFRTHFSPVRLDLGSHLSLTQAHTFCNKRDVKRKVMFSPKAQTTGLSFHAFIFVFVFLRLETNFDQRRLGFMVK